MMKASGCRWPLALTIRYFDRDALQCPALTASVRC